MVVVEDPADRRAIVEHHRARGVGRGGVELSPEAHLAVVALEQMYVRELLEPRAQRRTMAQIVAA